MKHAKYEYKRLRLAFYDDLEAKMNEVGTEGWALISVIENAGMIDLFFRRRIIKPYIPLARKKPLRPIDFDRIDRSLDYKQS